MRGFGDASTPEQPRHSPSNEQTRWIETMVASLHLGALMYSRTFGLKVWCF